MDDIAALKRELIALGAATDIGFEAGRAGGSKAVARIADLVDRVAAANPTPAPARADALLKGRWRMVYSSLGLDRDTNLSRLSFGLLPAQAIRIANVAQEVDPATGLYDNTIFYDGGMQVTMGEFMPADDHRMTVRFTEAAASGLGKHPLDQTKMPAMHSDVIYLDDELRLNRGSYGNIYVLVLEDRNPHQWSRDLC